MTLLVGAVVAVVGHVADLYGAWQLVHVLVDADHGQGALPGGESTAAAR